MSAAGQWFGWAVGAAVFAALTGVLAKVGVRGIDSNFATLIRTIVITVILAGIVAFTGAWSNPLALPKKTLLFLILSAFATGASWVCYYRALQLGDVCQVVPVDKASVVLAILFAALFLGERPTLRDWTGAALIAAGVFLLALKR
ncbi:MAG: EamA family transporter [Kiritimatiellaeota bacterium]|nr:EamA family transporter [Kiritimatiellota bacterium]